MKLPSDENTGNMNGDGYLSDEYDQIEMMPAPIRDGDFSEYMWMENEEEFNSQVRSTFFLDSSFFIIVLWRRYFIAGFKRIRRRRTNGTVHCGDAG